MLLLLLLLLLLLGFLKDAMKEVHDVFRRKTRVGLKQLVDEGISRDHKLHFVLFRVLLVEPAGALVVYVAGERERDRERQRDRETERQRDRETERQRERREQE